MDAELRRVSRLGLVRRRPEPLHRHAARRSVLEAGRRGDAGRRRRRGVVNERHRDRRGRRAFPAPDIDSENPVAIVAGSDRSVGVEVTGGQAGRGSGVRVLPRSHHHRRARGEHRRRCPCPVGIPVLARHVVHDRCARLQAARRARHRPLESGAHLARQHAPDSARKVALPRRQSGRSSHRRRRTAGQPEADPGMLGGGRGAPVPDDLVVVLDPDRSRGGRIEEVHAEHARDVRVGGGKQQQLHRIEAEGCGRFACGRVRLRDHLFAGRARCHHLDDLVQARVGSRMGGLRRRGNAALRLGPVARKIQARELDPVLASGAVVNRPPAGLVDLDPRRRGTLDDDLVDSVRADNHAPCARGRRPRHLADEHASVIGLQRELARGVEFARGELPDLPRELQRVGRRRHGHDGRGAGGARLDGERRRRGKRHRPEGEGLRPLGEADLQEVDAGLRTARLLRAAAIDVESESREAERRIEAPSQMDAAIETRGRVVPQADHGEIFALKHVRELLLSRR